MRSILFVEDDETLRESVADYLRMRFRVFEAADGMSALSVLSSNPEIELIISDQRLPKLDGLALLDKLRQRGEQIPFIMITAFGSVQSAVEAMRLGADDFIQKPFSVNELDRAIEKVFQFKDQKLVKLNELRIPIITQNQKMINILKICEVVAKSDCTVLIEGESGVGKEVIAKTIHSLSHRRNGPCIAINCGAIPEHLLESELFGFEKGAFTGADRKKIGKIELAHNGTLILDEISELPLPLQVKLLRVLQERTIERLGGTESLPVNFRLLAVSNKNLAQCCREGKFRHDLFYRLNVIPIYIPPLRERKDDIPLLAEFFLRKNIRNFRGLSPQIKSALVDYDWPGNVRELQNVCERIAILGEKALSLSNIIDYVDDQSIKIEIETVSGEQMAPPSILEASSHSSDLTLPIKLGMPLDEVERILILATLKYTGNNQKKAAEILGVSSRTLRNKLSEYRKKSLINDINFNSR